MTEPPLFCAAYPFAEDVLALPVTDRQNASEWYSHAFGLTEVERSDDRTRSSSSGTGCGSGLR